MGRAGTGRWVAAALSVLALGCHDPKRLVTVRATAEIEEPAIDFGSLPVGEWKEATIHVRNVGTVPFHALDALAIGHDPSFEVELEGGGAAIQPGEARAVTVRFHPLHEGTISDTVQVQIDAEQKPSGRVPIQGLGTPTPIVISQKTLDFQTLEIDSDRTLGVTVTNPVDLPLTLALAGPNAPQFSTSTVTIAPKSTVQLDTTYAPHANGPSQASVQVRACADCTPTELGLIGNSVPSAFVFDPAPVPFDDIPVHEKTRSLTHLKNITWRPVSITELNTSDIAFVLLNDLSNTTVQPNQAVEADLEFDARTSGPWVGTMQVGYQSDKPRGTQVVLDARGGRPQLSLTPLTLDFGDLPVGAKIELPVRLANAGSNGDLHFLGVSAQGDVAQFGVEAPSRGKTSYPWTGGAWPNLTTDEPIAPGTDFLDVKVAFAPLAAGDFKATITFKSDDLFNPTRDVTVIGHAHTTGPCSFRVDPSPELNFGDVPQGTGAVLGFRFVNTGTTECAVKDIHLSNDAAGNFFMPGGALPGGSVIAGSAFSAQIAFKPKADGTYKGELSITVNNPDTPVFKLPIVGVAQPSCLVAAPNFLDFGPIRYDCEPGTRHVKVSNQCDHPITLSQAWIGTGTSDQFTFVQQPATPAPLDPGQGVEAELAYARDVQGQHYSPLFFQATGETQPLLVPMLAETNLSDADVEHFTQGEANQLDVLFVVTNTTTMQSYQDRLAQAVPGWIDRARADGVDLQIGVTTSGLIQSSNGGLCPGGALGGEAGRLFPVDHSRPRILDLGTQNLAATLEGNVHVGICHNLVQGLEAMRAAASSPLVDHADDPTTAATNDGNLGFLRESARLAVVVVSDEDDHSGFDPKSYVEFLQQLKGAGNTQRSALYALVPTDNSCVTAGPPGPRYASVAQGTGGKVASICQGADGYLAMLNGLVDSAVGLQRDFHLTHTPADPGAITVDVNGAQVTGWSYDGATNMIRFNTPPPAGADVAVHYRALCGTGD